MSESQAAFLDGQKQELRVGPAEKPKPGPDQVVIRTRAVAVNPIDWKIQNIEFFKSFVPEWPAVRGNDIAGEIVEVGSNVQHLKVGDRAIAGSEGGGGFANFVAVTSQSTAVLPSNVSFTDGAVLPVAFSTPIIGLANLKAPLPTLDPKPSGKTLIVWGGSTSVGAVATQLAVAGGIKVVATASSKNLDFCKRCGASEVIDYKTSSVVEDVISAVQRVGGDFIGSFNCPSTTESFTANFEAMKELGGGNVTALNPQFPEPPANVNVNFIHGYGPTVFPFWKNYLTPALSEGKLKCLPEPLVVGKGLEAVQKGLEECLKVSANKIVIELD